jgi:hypothetical protein
VNTVTNNSRGPDFRWGFGPVSPSAVVDPAIPVGSRRGSPARRASADGEIVKFSREEDAHILARVGWSGREWARRTDELLWESEGIGSGLTQRLCMGGDPARDELTGGGRPGGGPGWGLDLAGDFTPGVVEDAGPAERPERRETSPRSGVIPSVSGVSAGNNGRRPSSAHRSRCGRSGESVPGQGGRRRHDRDEREPLPIPGPTPRGQAAPQEEGLRRRLVRSA